MQTASCMLCDMQIISSTGDLFDMLLPMLSIYQEYVRNHHYSLQVSTKLKLVIFLYSSTTFRYSCFKRPLILTIAIACLLVCLLQTLAECKQRPAFHRLLKLYEEKPACSGRTLEYFLTAPMHRVGKPRFFSAIPSNFFTVVVVVIFFNYIHCSLCLVVLKCSAE